MRGRGEGVELCRHVWWGGVGEGGCMFGEGEGETVKFGMFTTTCSWYF